MRPGDFDPTGTDPAPVPVGYAQASVPEILPDLQFVPLPDAEALAVGAPEGSSIDPVDADGRLDNASPGVPAYEADDMDGTVDVVPGMVCIEAAGLGAYDVPAA